MSQKSAASKSTSKESKFKLKNGLDVRLVPSSKSPVVSVQMWVKTGSADERISEQGISHFIEHLVFKGTEKYGVGEIARTVEASGGELNAWTSFDQTVFYVNISKEFTDTALDVIAQMMGSPQFDPKEIDAEREVVLEEIKRTNDNPSRKGSRLLFSNLYSKHPYRLPVIGRPEVVKNVSPKILGRYFKERYSAKNMVLVIGGDFDSAEMKKTVTKLYSDLPGFRVRAVKRATEPAAKVSKTKKKSSPKVAIDVTDVQDMQLHLAWPIPNAKHADIAGIETVSTVLGQGDSSRLVRALRVESDVVTSIGAGCFAPKDRGFFSVSAYLNPAKLTEALSKIEAELVGMISQPAMAQEIQRAITNVESGELYGLETADGLARKIGSLTTLLGDPSEYKKYLARIRGFDSKQALALTKKYLDPKNLTIVCLAPNGTDPGALRRQLENFGKDLEREWNVVLKHKPPKLVAPKRVKRAAWQPKPDGQIEIEYRTLSSGLKVVARRVRSTPVVSARIGFLGGSRLESDGQEGLSELLSRTWITGTKAMGEVELQEKIESYAAGIGAFGGRHTAGASAQMLTDSEKAISKLFVETVFEPKISSDAVIRERTMMVEALRTRADRPGQIASRLFMETMFAGHPYAKDPAGTNETLAKLSATDVESLRARSLAARDGLFVLTGNADLNLWCDALETATQKLSLRTTGFKKIPFKSPLKKDEFRFHEIKKEQSHIVLGWTGITLDDPRRYALQIAQAVLAGQGGRLFLELRDKNSLAYSVGPMAMEGVDAGYFGAHIGCTPEKGVTAIRMLKEEFQKLATTPIPQVELERAVRYLIGSHDLGLQKAAAVSSALLFSEIYGIPASEVFDYATHLRAVTAEDVRKLVSEIISKPSVIVAAGTKAPW